MLMIFAQIEGAAEAIKQASKSDWTATLVCVTFLFTLTALVWLIKKMFSEKDKLSDRLTMIEDLQRNEIIKLHTETAIACERATNLATENQEELAKLHASTAQACEHAASAADNNRKATEALFDYMRQRPCLIKTAAS